MTASLKYGRFRKARLIIWMGFLNELHGGSHGATWQLLFLLPFWRAKKRFNFVFGTARTHCSCQPDSFSGRSFINAYVMSRMKVASHGKHFSARAILSTVAGESADSLIFFPLAFGGFMPATELA